ncbi:hypothetical protein Tco_0799234 [Tanacetum coccineum]
MEAREEREMYTIEERSKLLANFFKGGRSYLLKKELLLLENKPPTRTQLRSLMMTYLKHTDFVPIGSERDEKMIDKMNKKATGMDEEEVPEEPENHKTFYENYGVHILALEDGTEIHMLAERRYPLIRETLERMMELRLTAASKGKAFTMSNRHQELASPEANNFCAPCYSNEALAIPEQMATGKEISNPFMAGSLPKTT